MPSPVWKIGDTTPTPRPIRVEVSRCVDVITMNYENGRRLAPSEPDAPDMYFGVFLVFENRDPTGYIRSVNRWRWTAMRAGEQLAREEGVPLLDMTKPA